MKLLRVLLIAGGALCLMTSCGLTVRPDGREVKHSARGVALQMEQDWGVLLKRRVTSDGLVDYQSLRERPEELRAIYAQVAQFSPDSHPALFATEAQRFGYWLNAYNIAVMRGVQEHYPIETVLEVKPFSPFSLIEKGGFFVGQKFIFGGKSLHLYELENQVLRKRFLDPRLHFALNCASGGCPELPQEAFQAARLEEQLDRETRKFINSDRAYRIDHERREVLVSKIFDWYRKDFVDFMINEGESDTGLLDYMERYLAGGRLRDVREARQRGYRQGFLEYDWSLNDSRPQVAGP